MSSICSQLPSARVVSVNIQSIRARNSNRNGITRNLKESTNSLLNPSQKFTSSFKASLPVSKPHFQFQSLTSSFKASLPLSKSTSSFKASLPVSLINQSNKFHVLRSLFPP